MGGELYAMLLYVPLPPPSTAIPLAIRRDGPETYVHKITNVPVFYMAHGLTMILMRANQLCRPLERVGPEISIFWAQMALASLFVSSGRKKVSISGLNPSNGPRRG
jgi:hypothetical protein